MKIVAAGKALPPHVYPQAEVLESLAQLWAGRDRQIALLTRLHDTSQVARRHFALPKEEYARLQNFTETNAAFQRVGLELAEAALRRALSGAHLEAEALDAIFFTTVTGLAVPTIDAHLVNRLRLRRDIKRLPLFGLGCVAGAAGLARMHDYLLAHPRQAAALVSVELCSLTLQRDDQSLANAVAASLFGDGASAVVAIGDQRPRLTEGPTLAVRATRSAFYYDTEQVMGWDIGATGFKIILEKSVPDMVRDHLAHDVRAFLAERARSPADVKTWICHPGGPRVLRAIEEVFQLSPDALGLTWESLRDFGNLSSSSVLFVLADTLAGRPQPDGSLGLLLAMGPGFCSELVELVWTTAS